MTALGFVVGLLVGIRAMAQQELDSKIIIKILSQRVIKRRQMGFMVNCHENPIFQVIRIQFLKKCLKLFFVGFFYEFKEVVQGEIFRISAVAF